VQDPLRIPRRQLDPEDFVEIARRNKGWIAGPTLACLVIAVVVAFLWPDTYVSTAIIRVVPPQVPERLVPSNVNTQMSQRITSMAQRILSRGTLTSIIETYGLYARQRSQLPLEDIIDDMRGDIGIGQVRSIDTPVGSRRNTTLTAFQVSFAYENRYLAQKVTGDIVSRFINENTRERANQAAMTTQFLKDQWQTAKNDLDAMEQRLTDFRLRYAGQLPDQWPVAVQQLSALETRTTALNGSISRLNQDKLVLESEMRVLRDRANGIVKASPGSPSGFVDPKLARMDEQIRAAERTLAGLRENYKSTHPDVQRYEAQVQLMRKERDEYAGARMKPDPGKPDTPVLTFEQAREIRDLNTQIRNMQIQVRAKDMQIEDNNKEVNKIIQRVNTLQNRLETAPIGQQEYTVLLRDYELAKRRYDDLNLKMSQSEIATDLENRKQGETMELLDPASLPETPTEPKRSVIVLFGVFIGVALGGLFVFVREMKDASLKTLKDVRAYTQLMVLGSVPLLENDLVVMRRRRLAWLAWTTACLFSAITMAGAVYYYYATKI
jgi:polysaccharide chain length determinant protein (PEP-CTERM system associated)